MNVWKTLNPKGRSLRDELLEEAAAQPGAPRAWRRAAGLGWALGRFRRFKSFRGFRGFRVFVSCGFKDLSGLGILG